ncbi:MAG TPA: hypothetical protein VIQ03_14115 [Gammaproteobacteria bacterium]
MSISVLSKLPELKPDINKRINAAVLSYIRDHAKPRVLVDSTLVANGKFITKPRHGSTSLSNPTNLQSIRKVHTLTIGKEHIINKLNIELSGGESYPILTTILGALGGAVTGGGSLLFSLATTGISIANPVQKVLARPGDEIWHVEQIGKANNKAVYVSAFFIVDPFRKQSTNKGWLIHEEREDITLE